LVDGGAVVSTHKLVRARAAMAARSLHSGFDRGREKVGVKGEGSGGWCHGLEGVVD
jgi:hypothetical protein